MLVSESADGEVVDSVQNENASCDEAPFLLASASNEELHEAAEPWSSRSLGPGFVWIQAGKLLRF
jgi:hypothetical protein